MNIDFPKEPSWDCPEGSHSLRLTQIQRFDHHITKSKTEEVRFVWDVISIDDPQLIYQVAKKYPLNCDRGSELRDDLKNWLGSELNKFVGADRNLDLDKLIGLEADGWVVHIPNTRFPKPFVYLKTIAPKGTFNANGDN
jgi:hypothetical protein